jgi:hypothetical protein
MTPKEEANKLFDKYCHAIKTEETDSGYFTNVVHAKKCAIIAVEEMIQFLAQASEYLAFPEQIKYWQQVKHELELI